MRKVTNKSLDEVIELSRLLGEFGAINRVTLLPGGSPETDSHHSFALALIAFELASQYAPELDAHKILLYSLVHDLSELVTGDVITLLASPDELQEKAVADAVALRAVEKQFKAAPHLVAALKAYEAKQDDEALFVYWIDKMMTIPTHFYDNGANLRQLGIKNQADIQAWYTRVLGKLKSEKKLAHASAATILELAYQKMHDELLDA